MSLLDQILTGKILVAGVGCLDRGDDGFGPALVRKLQALGWQNALDCGDRLEDFTLDIVGRAPDRILIADAVDMKARPGEIAVLRIPDVAGAEPHGHGSSLGRVMEYLQLRTGAEVLLLGVQPDKGSGKLSPEVQATIEELAAAFDASWCPS